MINNEIPQKLRLIASGTDLAGAIPSTLLSVLIRLVTIPSGTILIVSMILASIFQPIAVLFAWRATKNIHPFLLSIYLAEMLLIVR
jgi:hypothetical protein